MKRVVVALCLWGALWLPAEAKVARFKHFSLDIPRGYKVEERTEGVVHAVTITSPGGAQAIYQYEPRGKKPFDDWARAFAKRQKARRISEENDGEGDDYYVVEFERRGVPMETLIYDINNRVLTVTYSGKDEILEAMWETFLWK